MAQVQVFSAEEITDNTAHDSALFEVANNTGQPAHIYVQFGVEQDSAGGDNIFEVNLKVSPNYTLVADTDDALWMTVPQSVFIPIYVHIGASYTHIGTIASGNYYAAMSEMFGNFPRAKLVAQRSQISGGGNNTVTINAWIN